MLPAAACCLGIAIRALFALGQLHFPNQVLLLAQELSGRKQFYYSYQQG